jgi:hypothetical protein
MTANALASMAGSKVGLKSPQKSSVDVHPVAFDILQKIAQETGSDQTAFKQRVMAEGMKWSMSAVNAKKAADAAEAAAVAEAAEARAAAKEAVKFVSDLKVKMAAVLSPAQPPHQEQAVPEQAVSEPIQTVSAPAVHQPTAAPAPIQAASEPAAPRPAVHQQITTQTPIPTVHEPSAPHLSAHQPVTISIPAIREFAAPDFAAPPDHRIAPAAIAPSVPPEPLAPSAPAGVTAAAVSSGGIHISWAAVPDADGYYVYRGADPFGAFAQVGSSASTSYTNTGLSAGAMYYYRVAAYNSAGEGAMSDVISAARTAREGEIVEDRSVLGQAGGLGISEDGYERRREAAAAALDAAERAEAAARGAEAAAAAALEAKVAALDAAAAAHDAAAAARRALEAAGQP